jgi:hypothetical protein
MQYGAGPAAPLALYVAEQLAAWLSGALWFTGAAICLLVYALRRHRIDDFRGRYRVWLAGVAACIALSIASVTPVHDLIALVATQLTQHGALRDHAAWWLALAGLPVAWIVLRALVDARESPIATVLLFGGVVCFGLALASYLSAWPIASPRGEEVFTGAARLLGVWLTVVGFAAYGRFVVLDAQGLIVKERRRKSTRAKAKVAQDSKSMSNSSVAGGHARDVKKASAVAATAANSIRSFRQNMNAARPAAAASETRWVDGSEPEVDEYDDDDAHHGSKLSKSERKRLRKLKAQQRAA